MMPAYSATRGTFVLFAAFLVLGNWFLLNLVLAVVGARDERLLCLRVDLRDEQRGQ